MGAILEKQGKLEEAVIHYSLAAQIKPNFDIAHYNLGIVYYKLGRLDDAIRAFETALRINPKFSNARNNLEIVQSAKRGMK